MMKRRSILAMLGAAPVAAAMPASVPTPSHFAISPSYGSDFPNYTGDADPYETADLITKAKMRRDAVRRCAELGLNGGSGRMGPDQSFNIESLRATAPWRKALLQQEWYMQRRLYHADADVERSFKEAILPRWMWRFT